MGKRCKRGAFRLASVSHEEVAKEDDPWRTAELKPQADASRSSAVEAAGAAISACVADEWNRASGQEFPEGGNRYMRNRASKD